jgi:hypothetical protein
LKFEGFSPLPFEPATRVGNGLLLERRQGESFARSRLGFVKTVGENRSQAPQLTRLWGRRFYLSP